MKEFKIIDDESINVIFLDIDGVLNAGNYTHHQWLKDNREHTYDYQKHWCPSAVGNLKLLLDKFKDLYIVINRGIAEERAREKG